MKWLRLARALFLHTVTRLSRAFAVRAEKKRKNSSGVGSRND